MHAALCDQQTVRWRQIEDLVIKGLLFFINHKVEELSDAYLVDARLHRRMRQDMRDLGSRHQHIAIHIIRETASAEWVARREQMLLLAIPHDEGKVAQQMVDASGAPALVGQPDQVRIAER